MVTHFRNASEVGSRIPEQTFDRVRRGMRQFQEAEDWILLEQENGEREDSLVPRRLQRCTRFRRFLRQELRFCKTETEKEVIVHALRTTEDQIRRLEKRPESGRGRVFRAGNRRRTDP